MGRARRVIGTVGTSFHKKQTEALWHQIASDTTARSAASEPRLVDPSLNGAGFLIECADHPEVLAREALTQLEYSQRVVAALFVADPSRAQDACQAIVGSSTPTREPDLEVFVGHFREKRCGLTVWFETGRVRNRSRIIARIAEAAATQRDTRRRQEQDSPVTAGPIQPVSPDGVFDAPAIRRALQRMERVACTPLSVLFVGETGTGKEVLARLLHNRSSRAAGPFVPFNCASTPGDVLDSHLFGHNKGSFTGAIADSIGVIRAATGGTLFLDEIGEMPFVAQPKLLRFLEQGEVHPIGSPRPITADVRVVAATNNDLEQMVRLGTFREDLYFRLNGITIKIPPLRERREDIPTLARLFLGRFAASMGRAAPHISTAALELLLMHPWPGNVRQLSNEMRRLVALLPHGADVTADALAELFGQDDAPAPADSGDSLFPPDTRGAPSDMGTLEKAVGDLERRMILSALSDSEGRVSEAAERLGISRKGLFLKRRRLQLD